MIRWTWRIEGDPPQKSARPSSSTVSSASAELPSSTAADCTSVAASSAADSIDESVLSQIRNQSLFLDMDQWARPLADSPGNQGIFPNTEYARSRNENKREGSYSKMAEREMVPQVNQNPFMSDHSFVQDLEAQNAYMHPHSAVSM